MSRHFTELYKVQISPIFWLAYNFYRLYKNQNILPPVVNSTTYTYAFQPHGDLAKVIIEFEKGNSINNPFILGIKKAIDNLAWLYSTVSTFYPLTLTIDNNMRRQITVISDNTQGRLPTIPVVTSDIVELLIETNKEFVYEHVEGESYIEPADKITSLIRYFLDNHELLPFDMDLYLSELTKSIQLHSPILVPGTADHLYHASLLAAIWLKYDVKERDILSFISKLVFPHLDDWEGFRTCCNKYLDTTNTDLSNIENMLDMLSIDRWYTVIDPFIASIRDVHEAIDKYREGESYIPLHLWAVSATRSMLTSLGAHIPNHVFATVPYSTYFQTLYQELAPYIETLSAPAIMQFAMGIYPSLINDKANKLTAEQIAWLGVGYVIHAKLLRTGWINLLAFAALNHEDASIDNLSVTREDIEYYTRFVFKKIQEARYDADRYKGFVQQLSLPDALIIEPLGTDQKLVSYIDTVMVWHLYQHPFIAGQQR